MTGTGLRLYGALAGGVMGHTAMSLPQLSESLSMINDGLRLYQAEHDPQHQAWADHGFKLHLAMGYGSESPNVCTGLPHTAESLAAHSPKHPEPLRILISYWYYKNTNLDDLMQRYFSPPYPEIFADSGAYSALTQGAAIDLEEYAAWLKRWQHWFRVYANLDVIGNADATRQNQTRLEDDHDLAPLPVFHTGEDWAVLESYLQEYAYIALGGLVGKHGYSMPWLVRCFQMAKDRAVFHGFGVTSWQTLRNLPWYSVDSSSWGMGFRYGRVPIFDPQRGKFMKCDLGNRREWYRNAHLVRNLGFDPEDFADRERNDRAKICAISALSYRAAETWLRNWHGPVRIPERAGVKTPTQIPTPGPVTYLVENQGDMKDIRHLLGTSLYLADANLARLIEADSGTRVYLADTSNGINWRDAATAFIPDPDAHEEE